MKEPANNLGVRIRNTSVNAIYLDYAMVGGMGLSKHIIKAKTANGEGLYVFVYRRYLQPLL
jgi:hypothetical protein